MLQRTALGLAIVFALCGGAPAADGPTPPVAAAAPAPTDSRLAAAMDLLQATDAKGNMETFIDSMLPVIVDGLRRTHSGVSEDTLKLFQTACREEMVSSLDDQLKLQAQIYAEHFSEDELRALVAFYRSDTGRKYITEMPLIMKEVMPLGQAWGRNIGEQAVRRAIERLQKNGVQL
jgi:hypothetical protein